MLEIKNLTKVYTPKKGVPVTALNGISLKFPETGMIFLLGKSGSGKSTMLNLLGGLDSYDDGEIIIKGVSSKNFKQSHFDSYRNTYLGFIFQEYNILDEFSVGANIALAIELQGRKASDEEINEILKEVDLEGYGNRKPNELSGGQKQRVAIARALVKNPEIIMADEPTGALDSNTGRQVFDTLKKLSKDKLVIIVSHDREFSEWYADRIIELADGCVISDVELSEDERGSAKTVSQEEMQALRFCGDTVEISAGYHLTEEDRLAINAYMDSLTRQETLKLEHKALRPSGKKFVPTNQDRIRMQDGKNFNLIKSRLPIRSAFRIGASGLKYKKFRLVMTILLSCIAFGLFGLADTFGSYDHVKTCTNSLVDSNINYASLVKAVKYYYNDGDNDYYWDDWDYLIQNEELKQIESDTGYDFIGVVYPMNGDLYFDSQYDTTVSMSENERYTTHAYRFTGFAEITQKDLDAMQCSLVAGTIPDGAKDEIAISVYVYETFHLANYTANGTDYETVDSYEDMIGKTLTVNGTVFTVTGIVDTGLDLDRYAVLKEDTTGATTMEQIVNYALYNELYYAKEYSLASVCMVGEGYLDAMIASQPAIASIGGFVYFYTDDREINPNYVGKLSAAENITVEWIGEEKTTLSSNEIVIASDCVYYWEADSDDLEDLKAYFEKNSLEGRQYITGEGTDLSGYRVVGIIDTEKYPQWSYSMLVSEEQYDLYAIADAGLYSFIVSEMPDSKSEISDLVSYSNTAQDNIRYEMMNAVTYELEAVDEILKTVSKVFFFVGLGFAVFAALMLANFIGTSISYKKQEIGILRAIGSRSNDVFRIFFSESFIIAMVNFVVSAVGCGLITVIANRLIRMETGILITILNYGPRQILLLFGISIAVAAAASFIPVKKIAAKKPIDAIRNR